MTPLRQRMLDALVVRGKAVRTQEAKIDAVEHADKWLLPIRRQGEGGNVEESTGSSITDSIAESD